MKLKIPRARRKFAHARDEIDYLYHKLVYWFYERHDPRRARPFADRLERLLDRQPSGEMSIVGEECRSLICELKGDFPGAITHRENEIGLIRRLQNLVRDTPSQDVVLARHGYDDLSDRLDLLAILYHDFGDLEKAIRTLRESRQVCRRHGIPFDGEDLLQDYLETKAARRNGAQALSPKTPLRTKRRHG